MNSIHWHVAVYSLLFLNSTSSANGVEFSAVYTPDILGVASGGLSTGAEYLDNEDLELEIDVAEVWKAGAGRIRFHRFYNNGSTFSQYVRNPSFSPGLDDAWVAGCRIQLGY